MTISPERSRPGLNASCAGGRRTCGWKNSRAVKRMPFSRPQKKMWKFAWNTSPITLRAEDPEPLECVCLLLERGASRLFLPGPQQELIEGDRLLFAGRGYRPPPDDLDPDRPQLPDQLRHRPPTPPRRHRPLAGPKSPLVSELLDQEITVDPLSLEADLYSRKLRKLRRLRSIFVVGCQLKV